MVQLYRILQNLTSMVFLVAMGTLILPLITAHGVEIPCCRLAFGTSGLRSYSIWDMNPLFDESIPENYKSDAWWRKQM